MLTRCLSIRAWLGTISSSQIGLQTRFCWQREMLQSHFLPLSSPVPNLWDGSRGGRALTSIWTHLDANYSQLCQLVSTKVYHVSVVSVTLSLGCQLRPIWSNDVCCRVTFPPRIVYQVRSHLLPLKRLDSVSPQSVFNFSSNVQMVKLKRNRTKGRAGIV